MSKKGLFPLWVFRLRIGFGKKKRKLQRLKFTFEDLKRNILAALLVERTVL